MPRNKTNNKTPNTNPPNNPPTSPSEYIDNPNKDYKIIYASKETMDDVEDVPSLNVTEYCFPPLSKCSNA